MWLEGKFKQWIYQGKLKINTWEVIEKKVACEYVSVDYKRQQHIK